MNNKISPEEELSRYIYEKQKYKKTLGKAGYRFFMPREHRETKSLERSVIRTTSLNDTPGEIWKLGMDIGDGRKTVARGIVTAKDIRSIEPLEVVPETTVHRLHANIINWPDEKEDRMDLAKEINKKSRLDIRSSP